MPSDIASRKRWTVLAGTLVVQVIRREETMGRPGSIGVAPSLDVFAGSDQM